MIKKFLAITLGLVLSLPAMADQKPPAPTTSPDDEPKEIIIPKTKPGTRSTGFENEVSGLLADGLLTITFAEPEGMATVILSENGTATIYRGYHHTASPIIISAPDCAAPVLIQISTQEGNQYEGWID